MDWQIVGHDWAVALLSQSLETGRVAHAYLFTGPEQVGKTTLALALAQALNCTQPHTPCGECPSCRRVSQGTHPDVHMIEGEGVGGAIKIQQIRALQREAVLAPYEGQHRVMVLQRIDLATLEALNSLLKVLEEPPAHVVLIATALRIETLPSTVVSRCQRFDLRPAAYDVVKEVLQQNGCPLPEAQLLARLSGGRIGWALSAYQDEKTLRRRETALDRWAELMSADRVERLAYAEKNSKDLASVRQQIAVWSSWWRDLLLLCSQNDTGLVNVDRLEELNRSRSHITQPEALAGLKALQAAAAQVEANVNTRLALEGLLLQLPRWEPLAQELPKAQ